MGATPEIQNEDRKSRTRDGREKRAGATGKISKSGWRDILQRVKEEQRKDNIPIIAAGVAFYSLLSIIPAFAAMVSIYGLAFDPAGVRQQLSFLEQLLPTEAYQLIQNQLSRLVSSSDNALGLGVIVGLALSIWTAAKGMKALMTALNIAFNESESRAFLKLNGMALLLTFGGIIFLLVSLASIALLPAIAGMLPLPESLKTIVAVSKWPLLAFLIMVALSILYRFAPDREPPEVSWITWGAVGATLMWIVASVLFSFYVANFGSYNRTYGSMGAIVILLMWFFLTAYAVLMGAELNSEMEHRSRTATSRSSAQPKG